MTSRSLFFRLTPLWLALGSPVFAADVPATSPPLSRAVTAPDAAESSDVADLQRQLADTQDKLATALHSYALLEDENSRLKDESPSEGLRTQVRQLRDQVAELSAENAQLKTRIALLGPLPGRSSVPGRPSAQSTAP
jgi:septal ring factor EnvC (AmiA/AmiB activator)